jgi:hypothetical protein
LSGALEDIHRLTLDLCVEGVVHLWRWGGFNLAKGCI